MVNGGHIKELIEKQYEYLIKSLIPKFCPICGDTNIEVETFLELKKELYPKESYNVYSYVFQVSCVLCGSKIKIIPRRTEALAMFENI